MTYERAVITLWFGASQSARLGVAIGPVHLNQHFPLSSAHKTHPKTHNRPLLLLSREEQHRSKHRHRARGEAAGPEHRAAEDDRAVGRGWGKSWGCVKAITWQKAPR